MIVSSIIVVVIMLTLSAFFSGMEIAFVSANRLKTEIDRKQSHTFDYIADVFTRNSSQYITTILVGNNIALVIYSLYMSTLIQVIGAAAGWESIANGSVLLETALSTVIVIFVGEFIPKSMFKLNPNFYFRTFAIPIFLFYILLYPIAKLTTGISYLILRVMGQKVKDRRETEQFDREDLATLLEDTTDTEHEENEIKLFQNVLEFPDLAVRDCMVPRVDVEAVEADCPIEELTAHFAESQYSRIFVYEGTIDNIIGYVNSKSLFNNPKTLQEVMMKVNYVPETMPLQRLLTDFIKRRSYIAVVIDEFGGTAGIISLEDMLEEIFGEIEDEHDQQDMVEKRISESEYVLSARLEVEYLNEKYNLGIEESKEYDTLAGYVIYHHEGIPSAGETVMIEGKQIKVLRTSQSRIDLVRIKIQ